MKLIKLLIFLNKINTNTFIIHYYLYFLAFITFLTFTIENVIKNIIQAPPTVKQDIDITTSLEPN